jgi:hypothetical protein
LPEQVFIFRGNYWDKINYVNAAYSIYNYDFNEIITNADNSPNLQFLSRIENITHRPLVSLILAISYYVNDPDIFRIIFLIQLLFFLFIFLSLKILFSKFVSNASISAFIFLISFWTIYIFEIDSYSHFFSLPFFYLGLFFMIDFKNNLDKESSSKIIIFSVIALTLLYIYPELFLVFAAFVFLYFFYTFELLKIQKFLKNNFKIIIVFLIATVLSAENNIITTFNQIKIAYLSNVDWWGYYGGFILGKNNEIFQVLNIEDVRLIFQGSENFLIFIKSFVKLLYEKESIYLFLNFIPSLFGFYYLSINEISFYNFLYIALINLFLFNIFYKNLKAILKINSNISSFFKIFLFVFILLIISFTLGNNFWSIIKLYSYLGIFIFMLVFFDFRKKNIININKVIIIFILFFPLYKFTKYNSGIFKIDTLPSIIDEKMKTEINWSFPKKSKINCKNIFVDIEKELVIDYVRIKLLSYNYDNISRNVFFSYENNSKFNCKLTLSSEKFKFEKRS